MYINLVVVLYFFESPLFKMAEICVFHTDNQSDMNLSIICSL